MMATDCSTSVYKEKLLRLSLLVDVIQTPLRCLRQILLLFLDEVWDFDCLSSNQLPCSVCQDFLSKVSLDVTQETLIVLRFLCCQRNLKESDLVDILYGTFHSYQTFTSVYSSLRHWCRKLIIFFIQELRLKGFIVTSYIMVNEIPVAYLVHTEMGNQFLMLEQPKFFMLVPSILLPSETHCSITFKSARVVKRHHHVLNKRFKPKVQKASKK